LVRIAMRKADLSMFPRFSRRHTHVHVFCPVCNAASFMIFKKDMIALLSKIGLKRAL
jgi:hypothetical protein